MGRIHRKGESGIATTYISRKQALKRLQLSLKDFRRLCILKGIYPVEPSHKKKASKNNSTNKTYFLLKDIKFLSHEQLIDTFRQSKVYSKRLRKYTGKKDWEACERIKQQVPIYRYDHLVKERYPTFVHALRELDDILSLCFLFSTLPKSTSITNDLIHKCRRITVEFLHYVIETRSLRKVFVSIKGFYYQAEIKGETITWMTPHYFGYSEPSDVDFKIMTTFVIFYSRVLEFINFKLLTSINCIYPPKLAVNNIPGEHLLNGEDDTTEFVASLNFELKSSAKYVEEEVELDEFAETDDDLKIEQMSRDELKRFENLFSGCKIFLNREVPRESLVFIIRSFGGQVSFDKTMYVGATFDESDESITHQIVDRPNVNMKFLNRSYVQPQWVYDSVNARALLPVDFYLPGEKLPPHLSPFVEEKDGDYVPAEKKALIEFQKGNTDALRKVLRENEGSADVPDDVESSEDEGDDDIEESSEDTSSDTESEEEKPKNISSSVGGLPKKRKLDDAVSKMAVTPGKIVKEDKAKVSQKEAAEHKRLAIMMMHKKDKHLYDKIVFGQKRKKREALKLQEKRENLTIEKKTPKRKTPKTKTPKKKL